MVNPIESAYNMFLGFFNALPDPIRYFFYVIMGLFVIMAIVKVVLR